VLGWVVAYFVFVASEEVDSVAAYAHSRARNQVGVDGVAYGYVGAACAFGAHVALGGVAGEEVEARGVGGDECSLWDALFDCLQVFGAWVQEEMYVRVDEARHQGCVAEVDDLCSGWVSDAGANGCDALTLNADLCGCDDLSDGDIEHSRGA
jgi:hypothetical protein